MRICFWNTNKNTQINKYILNIIEECSIDFFVLAEYRADVEQLKQKVGLHTIALEEAITVGCDRITILKRGKNIQPGFQNKYCSIQIIEGKYILACLHLPSRLYADKLKRSIVISRIVEEIQEYEKKLNTDK